MQHLLGPHPQISSGLPHIRLDCCREQSMHGGVLRGGADGEEFIAFVVKRFTGEMATRLSKASALVARAQALNSQRLPERAFHTWIDVEPQ
jgi:hypothetical protein